MTSRRDFIKGGLAAAGSGLALGISGVARVGAQPAALAEADYTYIPLYFQPEEMRFLRAACGRLIPADEVGPGAVELGVPEFLDRQMAGPFGYAATWYMRGPFYKGFDEQGWQSPRNPRQLYRDAIAAINRLVLEEDDKVFADLEPERQDELLVRLQKGKFQVEGTVNDLLKLFFKWLLTNTKEGYFADPMYGGNRNMGSWRMLGFPGARGEFAAWVNRTGEPYPLPPVSIRGLTAKGG